MRAMSLETILQVTGGRALSRPFEKFSGIGTDSRADLKGQLFIALRGESFDAHDFAEAAAGQGAAGLLVHRLTPAMEPLKGRLTLIEVPDTLKALQALGRAARRESRAKVIALTGSNGKTTTKEFIAAILSPFRDVHYSKGSFNNHWGVPFTLLQLEPRQEVAVIEMGMNHAGEITELVGIAEPDIVLCTMVGRAHIEHFGSLEKIAAAKEEIYVAARPDAIRIYNMDDPQTRAMRERARRDFSKSRVLTFSGADAGADVHLKIASLTMREIEIEGHVQGEEGRVRVPVFGAQNLVNLMAAAAASLAAGLEPEEVWQGLLHCRTAWGRNQFVKLKSGAEMIFDAYNANPDSMKALIDNMKLVRATGRKIGVFGQMRELGPDSPRYHEEVGRLAGQAGFDSIFFIGDDAEAFRQGLRASSFGGPAVIGADYTEDMGRRLAAGLGEGDIVVVKASRGTKLERFVYPCEPLDFGK
ncbi:MAG: UDP-N-acetylmuramoyl-tripeptide--D-alanyl-D-alanine ligase [Bdellovibrionaceae bacterium]|nr:UDP-N-acetylmuramoyl-tripeptide--D-alanyl-D-alanine ligase [Pseudobdellovibrionaceae bacterium]MBX3032559.1 UDP-N-acetylmuramoyl-tripeptide--D-alanyl-D-alanine ligase [Pseudobdellovibrionaceae bacterium]